MCIHPWIEDLSTHPLVSVHLTSSPISTLPKPSSRGFEKNLPHEQLSEGELFSVAAFSHVQCWAACLPQLHFAGVGVLVCVEVEDGMGRGEEREGERAGEEIWGDVYTFCGTNASGTS